MKIIIELGQQRRWTPEERLLVHGWYRVARTHNQNRVLPLWEDVEQIVLIDEGRMDVLAHIGCLTNDVWYRGFDTIALPPIHPGMSGVYGMEGAARQ